MEISDDNCITPEVRMDKESSKMESRTQHWSKSKQKSGKFIKRWEDDINEFLKPEEADETRGNDLKSKDAWIEVAEDQKNGKKWKKDYVKR